MAVVLAIMAAVLTKMAAQQLLQHVPEGWVEFGTREIKGTACSTHVLCDVRSRALLMSGRSPGGMLCKAKSGSGLGLRVPIDLGCGVPSDLAYQAILTWGGKGAMTTYLAKIGAWTAALAKRDSFSVGIGADRSSKYLARTADRPREQREIGSACLVRAVLCLVPRERMVPSSRICYAISNTKLAYLLCDVRYWCSVPAMRCPVLT
eukprot:3015271-Rhodomonas_salina.1